ncbi:hypothetical protein [Flavobacterium sp. CS20]|uniref:hypothetical protein n=1 Tax=Flavobacterium sp. CS20 TaxID=2775246 RepID=UPI001B39D2C8|nr:hypothetical protein [Flavobacterium sp. CS20]QTY25983.1 hypothetical protein IGB25_08155 [Flavobacterium sp. CS20]
MKLKIIHIFFIATLVALSSCENSNNDNTVDDDNNEEPNFAFQNTLETLKTFGGSQEDDALSVVETQDGNIAVLGFTQSNDGDVTGKTTTDSDYWLLKLDKDLNLIWQKTFGGSSDDRGQKIITTADGGFLITGFSRSTDGDVSENFGFHDFWTLKLSASGDIIWDKSFGFSGNDRSYSAIQTSDGGYFVSGFLDVSASGGEGNDDGNAQRSKSLFAKHGVGEFWGIKLDANGQTQWRRFFGGTNNDRSYDVIEAYDGNIIMIGNSESDDFDITNPRGSYDIWAVKVNLLGDLVWQKNFGGSSIEIGYSIAKTFDGNYVLAGDTRSSDADVTNLKGNSDFWAIKFDDNAQMIWQKTYGGSDFESARDVLELQSNELLISGSSKSIDNQVSNNFGQNDVWIALTDDNGNLKNEINIGGSNLDFAQEAIQLQNGEVIVVGSSESLDELITENKGGKDVLIIKLK